MASASFFEASLAFADCSPPVAQTHSVTPKAAGLATPLPLSEVLPAELASCVSVFFPTQAPTFGWIVARLLDADRCVELRWLNTVQEDGGEIDAMPDTAPGLYGELDRQVSTPPVRFVFAEALLPAIHIAEADRQVVVQVLSRTGVLTRLVFSAPYFFLSSDLDDDVSADFALSTLVGKSPVLFHGVAEDVALVACSDGSLVSLRRSAPQEEEWQEAELNVASGLWPVRSLLPTVFSSRSLASIANSTESHAQVVSFASLVGGTDTLFDLTYTLSRDYKLRVWQNHGVCARTIDLSPPSSTALLAPRPRNLLRAVLVPEDADYSAYLVVAVEERFLLYGIPRGKRRETELKQIGVQSCPPSYSADKLCDFQIAKINPASAVPENDWVLWALWERANGEPLMAFTELAKADSGYDEPWIHVRAPYSTAWNADYFDELISSDPARSSSDIFMEHVFAPGRYPVDIIRTAIQQYASNARKAVTDREVLYALTREDYDSLAEYVADVVGCTLSLEISVETGQPLHVQFESRLRTEWLRFTSLCNELRAAACFPLALATDGPRQVAMAFTRDAIIAPVQANPVVAVEMEIASAAEEEEDLGRSGFVQAQGPVQEAIGIAIRAAKLIADHLPSASLKAFEDGILSANRSLRRIPHNETAFMLFEDHVENSLADDFFDDLLQFINPLVPHLSEVYAFLLSQGQSDAPHGTPATDFSLAIASASTSISLEERYRFAVRHLLLLVYLASDTDIASSVAQSFLPRAFAHVHGIYVLRWLAALPAPPLTAREGVAADDSGSLISRLGGLSMANTPADVSSTPTPAVSLLCLLARFRLPASVVAGEVLTRALAKLSDLLTNGLVIQTSHDIECNVSIIKFLTDSGLCSQALAFCDLYAIEDAGLIVARALALLGLGRFAEAQDAFERGAAGLAHESVPLAAILPADIWDSPERAFLYCRMCSSLFKDASYAAGVAAMADLGLRLRMDGPQEDSGVDVEDLARSLQQDLFEAHIGLQRYEAAYTSLMAMSDTRLQETCLRILVVSMSENDHVESLMRFSFAHLEQQLADHLDYRSRHAKFGTLPDYHQVAYAYHLSRGNYKSASAVMLRRVLQLDIRASADRIGYHDAARERCHSYLAAINALSLIDANDAWLALPIVDVQGDDVAEGKRRQTIDGSSTPAAKRRRLISGRHVVVDHIPAHEHAPLSARVDVVGLDILREEYTLALAKLSLASSFPELANADIEIDPEGVVSLYAEKGEVSKALALAQTLDADMTALFERLTDRCVRLSRNDILITETDADWLNSLDEAAALEGSLASRSWHVLRIYLERYDKPDGRYRLVVLRKTLMADRSIRPPVWLIASFADRDPDGLLRTLLLQDRLDEAFEQSVALVQKALKTLSRSPNIKTACLRLPYALLDQLLQIKFRDDEIDATLRTGQMQLDRSVRDLLAKIDKQNDAYRVQHQKANAIDAHHATNFMMR